MLVNPALNRVWRAGALAHTLALAAFATLGVLATACGAPEPAAAVQPAATTATALDAHAQASPTPGPRVVSRDGRHLVTLITGDQVMLRPDGTTRVLPGAGREGVPFHTEVIHGERYVIPADMVASIAGDRLDRQLFNVTRLFAYGYTDDRRSDIPLIMTRQPDGDAARVRMASAGVRVVRTLPALHAVALRQPKAMPGAALAELTSAGTSKLWLDRPRKLLGTTPAGAAADSAPDRNDQQIGAPAAWARGFTGAGVTVAVVDSGIDATHPDLAGKIVDAINFADDGDDDPTDELGHGTMVASALAGTGAASGGLYRGVAPDAQLLNARVCDSVGFCDDSSILPGLEWAVVDHGAQIVNLSLGAPDDPAEDDPVKDAVTQLAQQYGTLFVVAAGNDGADRTVESPASADAALAVGAVDANDQLASFSSRGPRLGDDAIKPDITAPGVDIIAARAAQAQDGFGGPVGDAYLSASGTSFSTPQVAGAAAILLQQHPDWGGPQLKAALIATAAANPALSEFEQGGGRLDVDRATRQTVSAVPGSLSFGIQQWPHTDDPVLQQLVSFHNSDGAPVTIALSASLALPDHTPAPAGMVTLSASSLTIAGGDDARLTVTIDTNGGGSDGLYSGTLVATAQTAAGPAQLAIPLAVDREVESYNLTVQTLDLNGAPVAGFLAVGSPTTQVLDFPPTGIATYRLPRDNYLVTSQPEFLLPAPVFMIYPRLELTRDRTIVLDSRLAKPIDVTVAGADLIINQQEIGLSDSVAKIAAGGLINRQGVMFQTANFGPDSTDGHLITWAHALMSDANDNTQVYHLGLRELGHGLDGWHQVVSPDLLATVHNHVADPVGGSFLKNAFAVPDGPDPELTGNVFGIFGFDLSLGYPSPDLTEHYFGEHFKWYHEFSDTTPFLPEPGVVTVISIVNSISAYHDGRSYDETWNQAVSGPAFADQLVPSADGEHWLQVSSAARTGDTLTLAPSLFEDAQLPSRRVTSTETDTSRLALFADGALISTALDGSSLPAIDVMPQAVDYQLVADVTRPSPDFPLSTEVQARWSFRSQHVTGTAPRVLDLPVLRFTPALDDHNQTGSPALVLPVTFERPPGADAAPIVDATLDVSFDDGASWHELPLLLLGEHAFALVSHPRGAQFVSLRGTARAADGNKVEQTIIRAYGLR